MTGSPQVDPRLDARVYEVAAELAYPRAVQDRHEEQARILLMRADAADEASGVRRVSASELADQLELARAEERQRISLCIKRLKLGTDDELDYDAGLTSALEAVGLVPTDEEPHPWRCGGKNCIWEQP